MEWLVPFLAKTDNIAIIVLALCLAGSGYLHIIWRREEREDRKEATATLGKVTEALNSLKNVIAAISGKSL